jgi:hypothetical protein
LGRSVIFAEIRRPSFPAQDMSRTIVFFGLIGGFDPGQREMPCLAER